MGSNVIELKLWRANSLAELAALAEEEGLGQALEQPVEVLLGVAQGRAHNLIALWAENRGSTSVGDALTDRRLLRGMKTVLGTGERKVLQATARKLLESWSGPVDAPRAAATGSRLPTEPEALIDWAGAHGLGEALEEHYESLLGLGDDAAVRQASRWDASISELLDYTPTPELGRRIAALAAKHLERRRAELADGLEEERTRRLPPLPPSLPPRLTALDGVLEGWWKLVRKTAAPRAARIFERSRLGLQAEPPAAVYEEDPDSRVKAVSVVIGLEAISSTEPRAECSWCDSTGCRHLLSALTRLRLLLRSEDPKSIEFLDGLISVPRWERTLRQLTALHGGPSSPSSGEPSRVAWRVSGEGSRVLLEPLLQKPNKSGFTRGAVVGADQVANDSDGHFLPADRAAAAMLIVQRQSYRNRRGPLVGALETLAGHPRIFHARDPATALKIAAGRLSLACARGPDGSFSLQPAVEGRPLSSDQTAQLLSPDVAPGRIGWLDFDRRTCWLLELPANLLASLQLLSRHGGSFPADAADLIADGFAPSGFPIELPPELLGKELPPRLDAAVYLTPFEGLATQVEVRIRPLPDALPLPAGAGPQTVRGKHEGNRAFVVRDLAAETALAQQLLGGLGLAALSESGTTAHVDGEGTLGLLRALEVRAREGLEVHLPKARPKVLRPAQAKDLRLAVRDGRFWFGLEGEAEIDGEQIKLALLLEAARKRQRYVKLSDGHFAELSAELSKQLEPLADAAFPGKNGEELGVAGIGLLEDLAAEAERFTAAESFRALSSRLKSATAAEVHVPSGLSAALRPYQAEGFRWLAGLASWARGACLADDMGLGKTVQTLGLLLHRKQLGPAMVVAPTSVCFNWEREAARFAPELKFHSYRGPDRAALLPRLGPGDVAVVSYGLLARDVAQLKGLKLSTLVLDEAQALKNADALRTRAARELDAEFRLGLTGTPLENHIGELWSLFGVLFPGLLGSAEQFKDRFAGDGEDGLVRARRLSRVLKPLLLRRTKGEVARDLPPRTEVVVEVAPSAAERKLYEQARLAAVAELAGQSLDEPARPEQKRFKVLAAMTRLRLLACHPRLHDPKWDGPASKLSRLLELLAELREEGHRALVFSQFTSHLAVVREALDAHGLRYLYLDGSTPEHQRRERVDAFQQGDVPVFLISLKAGGTGLNLTGADNVIHLDPWWNPAVEDQATDRAHRIGQQKPVTVYRLLTRGTIEEKILALHADKRKLVANVLEGTDAAGKLSTDELIGLLEQGARGDELEEEPDEAPAPPPAPTPAPHHELASRFSAWLAEEAAAGRIAKAPRKTYPRALARFFRWAEGRRSEDVAALGPKYLEALEKGEVVDAPASEPMLARPALKKLEEFVRGSS